MDLSRRSFLRVSIAAGAAAALPRLALSAYGTRCPLDYPGGTPADGVGYDDQALAWACSGARIVDLRGRLYRISQPVPVAYQQTMRDGTLLKGAHCDMVTPSSFSRCSNIELMGSGGAYSGRGFVLPVGSAFQTIDENCLVTDMHGPAVECVGSGGGHGLTLINGTFLRRDPTQEAIVLPVDASGYGLRQFSFAKGNGAAVFALNGGNATEIIGGHTTKITWTDQTQYTKIAHARLAFGPVIVRGNGTTIDFCTVFGPIELWGSNHIYGAGNTHNAQVILQPGAANCRVWETYSGQVVNNSGNATNRIYQ